MPRYAQPVHAPQAKKPAPTPAASRTRAQPAGAQPGAIWHAIQLKAARSAAGASTAGPESASALPASLQAGIEQLSGIGMNDVRVHRNSAEPAKLGALAYAQGSDIHLGPGQEAHLPHEAWHVVQQKQGRVRATARLKTGAAVNDHPALEREADEVAARLSHVPQGGPPEAAPLRTAAAPAGQAVRQHKLLTRPKDYAESGGTRAIFFNDLPAQAKYWTKTIAQTAKSRPELLTSMAAEAAVIGNAIQAEVAAQDPVSKQPRNWIFKLANRNDATNFEPVRASLTGKYEAPGAQPSDPKVVMTLEVDYHYGSNAAGYVVRVHDAADTGAKDMVFKKHKDITDAATFSHTHRRHGTTPLASLTKDPDATAKVAGEGARWQAVGRSAGKLRDDSLLFTNEVPTKDFTTLVRTFSFNQLYVMWKSEFGMQYGIDDATVVKALQKPELTKSKGGVVKVGESEAASSLDMGKDICLDSPEAKTNPDLEERAAVSVKTPFMSVSLMKTFADEAKAMTGKHSHLIEPFGSVGYANGQFEFAGFTKGPLKTVEKVPGLSKTSYAFPAYRLNAKAGPAKLKIPIAAGDKAFQTHKKDTYDFLIYTAAKELATALTPPTINPLVKPAQPIQVAPELKKRMQARFKWTDGPLPVDLAIQDKRKLVLVEIAKEITAEKEKPVLPSIPAPTASVESSQAPKPAPTQPAPVDSTKK